MAILNHAWAICIPLILKCSEKNKNERLGATDEENEFESKLTYNNKKLLNLVDHTY